MQLSQGFKALLRRSRGAAPLGAPCRSAINSSAASGRSQEGPSEEGKAPLPDFTTRSGTEDPWDVAARVGQPGPGSAPSGIENPREGPGDYSEPQIRPEVYASGGNSNDLPPEQREQLVANASEETRARGGDGGGGSSSSGGGGGNSSSGGGGAQGWVSPGQTLGGSDGTAEAGSGAGADPSPKGEEVHTPPRASRADRAVDDAAAQAAGPLGRLVPPDQVRAEGSDLPPGHDGSGATLDSTTAQSDG